MTNKTKPQTHTPGPWEAKRLNSDLGQRFSFIGGHQSPEGSCVVATIPPVFGTENLRIQEADARLIAAAPDQNVALLVFIEAYEKWNRREDGGEDDMHEAAKMARAAISKAHGGC